MATHKHRTIGRKVLLLFIAMLALAAPSAALAGGSLGDTVHYYDYGTVAIGSSSTNTFTFTNVGPQAITVGEIQSTGFTDKGFLDFNLDYTGLFSPPSCFTGLAIAPGSNCTLSFLFAPSTTGRRWQQVTVVASDGSTARMLLVGTGA